MWRRLSLTITSKTSNLRFFSTAIRRNGSLIEDEGDWFYSSEWWGTYSEGHTVFRSSSDKGNGIISVVSHPCSKPEIVQWTSMEKWLQQRYAEIHSENEQFTVLGYRWRVLRFNDFTRQTTAKIMAACRKSDPLSVFIMQQPHILAVPYLKSMVSVGLATLASCRYDLKNAVNGQKPMRVLCIGHGGGSLPLFLASKIQGAIIDIVEIDPLVILASTQAMGFPASTVMTSSGRRALAHCEMIDEVMWKGTHERLCLYEIDAEEFIVQTTNVYDLVFIDAYDGDDIFPHKLWDPSGPFLETLGNRLHPEHGTVVVNLHADSDILDSDGSDPTSFQQLLPMGKYVSRVCKAYKKVLVGHKSCSRRGGVGLGFIASVPWLCNTSLVVCRGFEVGGMIPERDSVLNTVVSNSQEVEDDLNLPFSCFEYINRGFVMVD
ncbi:hypothetical protein IFM89_010529 [Coptis chinensis]|uniref:S-adenosyl-L-methionine-dependent methyltransferase superfamily protein n=1 Tax=Coptis chinensis TaxID=261450 RepID=A0A835LVJ5_9MAGN|nr:hypothetical protein IFM89_010529 [Coptis chinensis]